MSYQILNLDLLDIDDNIISDLKNLYLTLNSDLSNNFQKDLEEIKKNIYVLRKEEKIVGVGTILIEKKLIHKGKK